MGASQEASVSADRSAKEAEEEAFLRQWTIPEEDRGKYTTQPWGGVFRWFRSSNGVCLERYRLRKTRGHAERLGPA
jgi:hypothetical protein